MGQSQWDDDKEKWDTEKNNLQSQWNSDKEKWNTEKQDLEQKISEAGSGDKELQDKYKELEKKYKNADYNHKQYENRWKIAFREADKFKKEIEKNIQELSLDRFLIEPDKYNQLLKQKMSGDAVRTFTEGGDVKIDFKKI